MYIFLGRGVEEGLTNERSGTDHGIGGPMRGLEKNYDERGQVNKYMDIATTRPKRPKGRFNENTGV